MPGGWRREIAVLLGVRCMITSFGGVLRNLKQTNGGAQRYTINQSKRGMEVRGNMSGILGS